MIEDNLLWFILIPLLILIFWLRFRVEVVPQEKRLVVYRLGRFSRLAGPGPVLLLKRIEKVERTIHARDQPERYLIDGLFIYDIPFGFTLNLWRRFDLATATQGQAHALAELAQFDDEERNVQIQIKLREALVQSIVALQQQRPLPPTALVIERLLPIVPGMAECIQILANVHADLEHSLPSIGVILNDAHPISIERLHLSQDLIDGFNRNRTTELLRQRFPNLPEDTMVQVITSIEGANPLSVGRISLEGIQGQQGFTEFKLDGQNIEPHFRAAPPLATAAPPVKPAQPAVTQIQAERVQPSAGEERLSKADLQVLKAVPQRYAGQQRSG